MRYLEIEKGVEEVNKGKYVWEVVEDGRGIKMKVVIKWNREKWFKEDLSNFFFQLNWFFI